LEQLSQVSGEYQEAIRASSESIENAAEQLRSMFESAMSAMEEQKTAILGAFDELKTAAEEKLEELASQFDEGVEQTQQQISEVLEQVDLRATTCVDQLAEQLSHGAIQGITGSVEEAIAALTSASELTDGVCGEFGGSLEDVTGNIREICEIIEKIKPVLDAVNALL